MTDRFWLLVLASLVALGLTLDVLLLYGVTVAVQAVLTWPIVNGLVRQAETRRSA